MSKMPLQLYIISVQKISNSGDLKKETEGLVAFLCFNNKIFLCHKIFFISLCSTGASFLV